MASQGMQISQTQIDALAEAIRKHEPKDVKGVKESFCHVWPTAKTALQALEGIIAAVPGVGIFAGPAIAVVVAAGNAADKAVCK